MVAAVLGLGAALGAATTRHKQPSAKVSAAASCNRTAGTTVHLTIPSGGDRRSALLHLPRHRRGTVPLLIALHGAKADGAFMQRYSGLSRLADRNGFAVVYPDAVGGWWGIAQSAGDGDVRFIDALIGHLLAGGCIDPSRVSVVGVSNGGGMAARLACAAGARFAGLVTVAGSYRNLPGCESRRPLSVLEIHGTADAVVPYNGIPSQPRSTILTWLRGWTARDGCVPGPRRTVEARNVLRLTWDRCRGGAVVEHLRLIGGRHAWPGATPPDPGPNLGVSASGEAWEFLRHRRLAAPVRGAGDR